MASITSVISLFVVLFVTYCHAVPIGDVSTSDYEVTTDTPVFGHERRINMELTADEESTVAPHYNEKRISYGQDSEEYTTPSQFKKRDGKFHHKRTFGDAPFTTPATDFVSEEPHDLHSSNNHVFNNLETSTEFNKRATRYGEGESEENREKRTQGENKYEEKRAQRENEYEEKRSERENELEEKRAQGENKYEEKRAQDENKYEEKRSERENELEEKRAQDENKYEEKRAQRENEFETTTDFEFSSSVEPKSFVQSESSSVEPESSSVESESSSIEPESRRFESSSSVDSFGTSTGFLHRAESEERPTTPEYEPTTPEYVPTTPEYVPTTPEYVPTTPVYVPTTPVFRYVRPSVQPPTRFPVNKQRLTQTETIIPGKITETKIFANAPSQTFIVSEPIPVRQSQLSQGRSQPFVKKEVSDN
jgi:hypothetical protein